MPGATLKCVSIGVNTIIKMQWYYYQQPSTQSNEEDWLNVRIHLVRWVRYTSPPILRASGGKGINFRYGDQTRRVIINSFQERLNPRDADVL